MFDIPYPWNSSETGRIPKFQNNIGKFGGYKKKIVILHHVLVRGNAINRESGENPEQTRYCKSFKTH